MIDKLAKYGEFLMLLVVVSFFPMVIIYDRLSLPAYTLICWCIVAAVVLIVGWILNGIYIKNESARINREFEEMMERHQDFVKGLKK